LPGLTAGLPKFQRKPLAIAAAVFLLLLVSNQHYQSTKGNRSLICSRATFKPILSFFCDKYGSSNKLTYQGMVWKSDKLEFYCCVVKWKNY